MRRYPTTLRHAVQVTALMLAPAMRQPIATFDQATVARATQCDEMEARDLGAMAGSEAPTACGHQARSVEVTLLADPTNPSTRPTAVLGLTGASPPRRLR